MPVINNLCYLLVEERLLTSDGHPDRIWVFYASLPLGLSNTSACPSVFIIPSHAVIFVLSPVPKVLKSTSPCP